MPRGVYIFCKIFEISREYAKSMSANLIIVTGLIYAYIALEQALKGNMGLACMYSGYCFANYGAYLIATK
jgi:hypothetical protein